MNTQETEKVEIQKALTESIEKAIKKHYPKADQEEESQLRMAYGIGMCESLKRLTQLAAKKKHTQKEVDSMRQRFIDDMLLKCFRVEKLKGLEYKGFIAFLNDSFIDGIAVYADLGKGPANKLN